MRTSLWLRLMGIFAVIILTGVVVTFVVVNLATASQFRRFVLTGDLIQAQNLSSLLADFYTQQGNWQGVESLLTTGAAVQSEMMEGMMSQGMMRMMEHGSMGPERMQEMFDAMRSSGHWKGHPFRWICRTSLSASTGPTSHGRGQAGDQDWG